MSDNSPTEMNVPTQSAKPEAAPGVATASASESASIIPALDVAQPDGELTSEPVPAPAPGPPPGEDSVASGGVAEQTSAPALTTVPLSEQGGAPVTQTESAQDLVTEAESAAAPPITADPALAAAPAIAADTALVTDPALTPGQEPQTTMTAVIASGSDSEGEPAPSTATAPEAEDQPEHRIVERPRSEQLWFYDGNIIIQTPAKQYRVHRSVLAMHSTFFKDMFELPPAAAHGKQANPMLDGCPVVQVPDAAEDWDAVLSIIYHTWEGTDEVDQIIPVEIMLAMLRLGHKYDFERLRTDALRQLKNIFPGNIKACDAQFSDSSTLPIGKFRLLHMSHSFKMIAAAVDLGIETVLPSAYAMVLRHIFGMSLILDGQDIEDDVPVLSQETRNIILRGDRAIQNDSYAFLFDWLRSKTTPAGDECQFPENCTDELLGLLRKYPDDFPGVDNTSHIVLRQLSTKARNEMSGLCIPCFNAALAAYDKGRAQMFENLPMYFWMPPWDELQDFYTR